MTADQIWQSLAAGGPLAIVLGFAVWTLWQQVKEKERQLLALYERILDLDRKERDA